MARPLKWLCWFFILSLFLCVLFLCFLWGFFCLFCFVVGFFKFIVFLYFTFHGQFIQMPNFPLWSSYTLKLPDTWEKPNVLSSSCSPWVKKFFSFSRKKKKCSHQIFLLMIHVIYNGIFLWKFIWLISPNICFPSIWTKFPPFTKLACLWLFSLVQKFLSRP